MWYYGLFWTSQRNTLYSRWRCFQQDFEMDKILHFLILFHSLTQKLQPPFGNSDQIAIKCQFRLCPQTSNLTKYVYTNYSQIRHELSKCDWSFVKFIEVEGMREIMKNVLLDTVNKSITIMETQTKNSPLYEQRNNCQ